MFGGSGNDMATECLFPGGDALGQNQPLSPAGPPPPRKSRVAS